MRFTRHMRLEHGLQQIDLVPLINMNFLLLIFFMLTSTLVMQPAIDVRLPKAVTGESVRYQTVEIVIAADNIVYMKGRQVTTVELAQILKYAGERNQSLLIKSDRRSSLGRAVEVWDMARDAGIGRISVATDQG